MKLKLPTAFVKKNWEKKVRLVLGKKRFNNIQETGLRVKALEET